MSLRFMTAGESHGPTLVAILEGIPAGLQLEPGYIDHELWRRQQGIGAGPRMKIERDQVSILGGVMDGRTTGAPIALSIPNLDHVKWHNRPISPFTTPRPGHADLTGAIKYGFHDLRPALERASARETAARVAVGAVCKRFLIELGVHVGGYVLSIGDIFAQVDHLTLKDRFVEAEKSETRCPDAKASEAMAERIHQVIKEKDTLGGIIEIIALGVPPGLGSYVQWDRRLEARLGAALLSVQAIKGVEFGPAFENTQKPGTSVHDPILLEENCLIRPTNRSGGLEGGITNGEPLIMRAAMKPIATTLTPIPTVNLATKQETLTNYERSDFCPVPRAVPILESMVAYVLADALLEKLGGDSMDEITSRLPTLRLANLTNLAMDNEPHIFWDDATYSSPTKKIR